MADPVAEKKRDPTNCIAMTQKKEKLNLHTNPAKVESSLVIQIRTENLGFAQILHRQWVRAATSAACDCELWPPFTDGEAYHSSLHITIIIVIYDLLLLPGMWLAPVLLSTIQAASAPRLEFC